MRQVRALPASACCTSKVGPVAPANFRRSRSHCRAMTNGRVPDQRPRSQWSVLPTLGTPRSRATLIASGGVGSASWMRSVAVMTSPVAVAMRTSRSWSTGRPSVITLIVDGVALAGASCHGLGLKRRRVPVSTRH